jgi:hypothetical protein
MPRKKTAQTTAFDRAYQAGDLAAMVALARTAFAAKMFTGALEDDPGSLVDMLLEEEEEQSPRPAGMSGDAWDYHCRNLFAALAMGIAIGQLVHPDVFAKGSVR